MVSLPRSGGCLRCQHRRYPLQRPGFRLGYLGPYSSALARHLDSIWTASPVQYLPSLSLAAVRNPAMCQMHPRSGHSDWLQVWSLKSADSQQQETTAAASGVHFGRGQSCLRAKAASALCQQRLTAACMTSDHDQRPVQRHPMRAEELCSPTAPTHGLQARIATRCCP